MENTRISHYEIGRRLGRGGMGEVYEALDLDLDRKVALKFIAPELAADPDALKRFEREARAAAALSHPHIATLYAFEREGPRSFIAMELVGGESLRDRVRRGPLPIAEALAITRDSAAALAMAHRRGIVHRDVKPENLMFDTDGAVKLMDFGLARAAQSSRLTVTGSSLGTAAYMPPEAMGSGAGAAGDVYALGVVLYEMLAGALPFTGDNPLAMLYSSANQPPKPLRPARPEVSEAVETLVGRMLEKDPERRPDAPTVAKELAAITGTATAIGAEAGERGSDRGAEVAEPTRRRAWMLLLLAVPVALGLVWLIVPGVLRERDAARRQQAIQLTDEGIDSLQRGRRDAAQARFEAALRMDPNYGKAGVSLGRVLHARGDDARAALVLRDVLARSTADDPAAALARDALADMDMAAGNWAGAVQSLRLAFNLDSSGVRSYNQLAFALIRAGQPDEAIDLLARAIPRFPGEPALHKNMGLAVIMLGDAKSAEAEAERALAIHAAYAPALGLRARARARQGDLAGARADWARYLALLPSPGDSAEVATELAERGALP